jgi:hypothetical protein
MTVMADKGVRSGARSGRERIQKLAQAALNADVTVDQVDAILEGLGETLVDLNNSTETSTRPWSGSTRRSTASMNSHRASLPWSIAWKASSPALNASSESVNP